MADERSTDQISTSIARFLTSKHVPPKQVWLQGILPTLRLNMPVAALQQTALFRVLSSDLTTSVQASPHNTFPANIADPTLQELRLQGSIMVQVLDLEDVAHSRWSQAEAIEMEERGERTRGREVVRVVADPDDALDGSAPVNSKTAGPHKLLVQDAAGTRVYAFELELISGLDSSMAIGTKVLMTNSLVARGVIMLRSASVQIIGGKVEAWDRQWRDTRKDSLKERASQRDASGE